MAINVTVCGQIESIGANIRFRFDLCIALSAAVFLLPLEFIPSGLQAQDMSAHGCCAVQGATNGWNWIEDESREQCLREAHSEGLPVSDVYHFPDETCDEVKKRCDGVNPCENN